MIQTFTKADVNRVSHLQPDGWEDINPFFQFYAESGFCHAIKIEDKNRIVALGSIILLARTAWFAHIIVEPHMHRRGFGTVITRELIADLGITLKRTATRMVRNGDDPLNQRMVFNRIGGHIG